MSQFKTGDLVKCIFANHQFASFLVIGGVYTVKEIGIHPNTIRLMEDNGSTSWDSTRFEPYDPPSLSGLQAWLPAIAPQTHHTFWPTTVAGSWTDTDKSLASLIPSPGSNLGQQYVPVVHINARCECGVDSIGGGKHSNYCPKYN